MTSALARRVVRHYPKPWRERYEGELLALLDDAPPRLRDVVDLTRGLMVERVRSIFEPGDRPTLTTAFVALKGEARATAILVVPLTAGWAVRSWLGSAPRSVALAVMLLQLVVWIALAIGTTRAYPSTAVPFMPLRPVLSPRAGFWWRGALLVDAFLVSWALPSVSWWMFFFASLPLSHMTTPHLQQEALALASHNLRTARREMKHALAELQRCERLVAEGGKAPLQYARNVVDRLTRQQDEALATLNSFGYRATLRTRNLEHS